ncbi:hypothetical protein [Microbacterium sp. AG238]|uniref:hypothetical protein n=1 Tax=Microbacterium sp. AG238 TaxID=2183994 RepID=UPI000E746719|nr:hypothetical protein [Microbacterium sp. AG238]RKE63592.1 hypothetical protein DEU36_0803 [Microbacterium sp. AG238]
MTTKQGARAVAWRVLRHPLLWSAVCLVGAVPLLSTEHDFWGFLLCLLGGWSAAHALIRRLLTLPGTLSLALHLAASVGAALLLFALTADGGWRHVLPPAIAAAIGFAAVPGAGWIWLTLIGRTSAAVASASRRRAATLVVPEWERVGDAWHLRLAAVSLRSPVFVAITATIAVLGGGLITAVVIVFDDVVQRMGPLLLLLVLGWVVGAPGYLVVRAIAHRRTADVVVTLEAARGSATVRVVRSSDGDVLVEAPASAIGSLQFAPRSSPTRIVIRPSYGPGLVLLVGLALPRRDTAPTFPLPPADLVHRLASAGLVPRASRRSRNGDLALEFAGGGTPT